MDESFPFGDEYDYDNIESEGQDYNYNFFDEIKERPCEDEKYFSEIGEDETDKKNDDKYFSARTELHPPEVRDNIPEAAALGHDSPVSSPSDIMSNPPTPTFPNSPMSGFGDSIFEVLMEGKIVAYDQSPRTVFSSVHQPRVICGRVNSPQDRNDMSFDEPQEDFDPFFDPSDLLLNEGESTSTSSCLKKRSRLDHSEVLHRLERPPKMICRGCEQTSNSLSGQRMVSLERFEQVEGGGNVTIARPPDNNNKNMNQRPPENSNYNTVDGETELKIMGPPKKIRKKKKKSPSPTKRRKYNQKSENKPRRTTSEPKEREVFSNLTDQTTGKAYVGIRNEIVDSTMRELGYERCEDKYNFVNVCGSRNGVGINVFTRQVSILQFADYIIAKEIRGKFDEESTRETKIFVFEFFGERMKDIMDLHTQESFKKKVFRCRHMYIRALKKNLGEKYVKLHDPERDDNADACFFSEDWVGCNFDRKNNKITVHLRIHLSNNHTRNNIVQILFLFQVNDEVELVFVVPFKIEGAGQRTPKSEARVFSVFIRRQRKTGRRKNVKNNTHNHRNLDN